MSDDVTKQAVVLMRRRLEGIRRIIEAACPAPNASRTLTADELRRIWLLAQDRKPPKKRVKR